MNMDLKLCDELLQEIFQRAPFSSSTSISLVCKRWLYLYRASRISLSLRLTPEDSSVPTLSSILSHCPRLSSLSILLSNGHPENYLSDNLLAAVGYNCWQLHSLRFLAGPVSLGSLISLSTSCKKLTSLSINLSRPVYFGWVASFPCLKEISIHLSCEEGQGKNTELNTELELWENEESDADLQLESLCLSGIQSDDMGFGWLWRSCKRLKKLQLRNCQSVGKGESYSSFIKCLQNLEEVELRTCRSIVDIVLLKLAENCNSLNSLLVYDGGSREGLLRFFTESTCSLHKLDLRLPLDLDNHHLSAVALNQRRLSKLRLQSCCLVTGEGLKALGVAMNWLEELALINCDVVEKEPRLLPTLGQHWKQLKKLDLSYSETLHDKTFVSMLESCNGLIDLRLKGCKELTDAAIVSMVKSCKQLQIVDIRQCGGIKAEAIEMFLKNSPQLRKLEVEERKLPDSAKRWACDKSIEIVI